MGDIIGNGKLRTSNGISSAHRPSGDTSASVSGRRSIPVFVCQACDTPAPTWAGRCASCGAWNCIIEEGFRVSNGRKRGRSRGDEDRDEGSDEGGEDEEDRDDTDHPPRQTSTSVRNISAVVTPRISTGIEELDRVLGGGVVPGGVTLISGPPGIGKSTLLLQAMASLSHSRSGERCLYASGEESLEQTGSRAKRIGVDEEDLSLMSTGELDDIFEEIERIEPSVIVIDSIQTVRASNLESSAGTVSQLREVTAQIVSFCKERKIAAFLVGHITKEGTVAGPKLIEHLVDTVLAFEGEKEHSLRVLRVTKNRAGSESEVGVFEMTAEGMIEVPSPSARLLAERAKDAEGNIVACSCEGTRSMLVEVQALVTLRGNGRKSVNGLDSTRLGMILAVLRDAIPGQSDIFLNLAGGIRVIEPGIDLGIAIAITSSAFRLKVPEDIAVFGEVGLTGEIRSAPRAEARINEAVAMGFKRIIVPASLNIKAPRGVKLHRMEKVKEAIAFALGCKIEEIRYTKEMLLGAGRTREERLLDTKREAKGKVANATSAASVKRKAVTK